MGTKLPHKKALLITTLCLLSSIAWSATPPNSTITNTATAAYSIGVNNFTANSTATVSTAACNTIGIKIELLQYVPPAGAAYAPVGTKTEPVQPTGYAPGGQVTGPFSPVAYPTLQGNSTTLPANLLLSPMNDAAGRSIAAYSRNEPVFIRVTSYDANINPAAADRISVTLTTTASGDSEVLQLTETGPSTGVFVGAVPSVFAAIGTAARPNDGKITISSHNDTLAALYNHTNCTTGANIVSSSSGLIDPYGVVFDSTSGAPVNGATIRKINLLTGLAATVYCDDGVTVLPQPVISGSPTVCDATMDAGGYHFPLVPAGNYKLVVTPPQGYAFPSSVPAVNLPKYIGTPKVASVILGNPGANPGGSYGGAFRVWGNSLRIDIPVDPGSTSMSIQKIAGKAVVGIGEFIPYTLTITNNSTTLPIRGALIADHLPPGFRYQKGSARLNGVIIADPLISQDARALTFKLDIAQAATATLHYVLEVTPGARPGIAENIAAAIGTITSNTARASVLVREDLFRNQAILVGRVIDGPCSDRVDNSVQGLANARVALQDGTYVLTDKDGRWHIDNLRPGTHVVQLDLDSLPKGYEVSDCNKNSRVSGHSYAQFVNLRGGTLWRADFFVQRKASSELIPTPAGENADIAKESLAVRDPARLVEVLPYDELWLSTALPGNEWLHPQENFHPNLPAMKVAVKHDPKYRLTLTVNGETVSPLLFEGTLVNQARSVALSSWNAVPVKEGDNQIELLISDEQGQLISRTVRLIHYSSSPDHVEFVPEKSRLISDGKTRPMIAVRFLDKNNVPVRRGITGEFQLNEPYRSYNRSTGIARDPLTGAINGRPRFEIDNDGLALIELEPTTQSGDAILNFQFNDLRHQEVRAWLAAPDRDWILVGFAEGTAGHKTLSGNLQGLLAADTEKQLFDSNKLAFYAKGRIRGDYLLTMAYDTGKKTGNKLLKQAVDPTQFYTLYADASQSRFDAATASRLYLKLERKQFYAMFGDYDTGLSVTELSRYSRTMNGIKSEYKGEKAAYNAFASVTSQAYGKEEIPGNGTSGVYKLSRGNLVINSDKIRIESRDRFQSHIIAGTRSMTRYLDYDIDYAQGTLTFHEPIAVKDSNFNPNIIVVEYESADPADKAATFGGRASFKPVKDTEIGATLIREGTAGATGDLQGLDAAYQIDEHTRIRAEAANTRRNRTGVASGGSAWLGEVQHHDEQWDAKAYVREQATGFGLGQQAGSEIGTRKMGMDGRVKLSETLRLQGLAYRQENLSTHANNRVLEGRMDQIFSPDFNAYYGARTSQDSSAAGRKQSNQLITGAAYTLPDKKITLRGAAEIGNGTAGSISMPDRLLFGVDYKVTEQSKLFAEQEFARGELIAANTTRVGVRTQPWSGAEMTASVGNNFYNDAQRLYSNMGLVQRWQVNEQWQTDFSVDRSQTLRNTGVPLNINTAPAYGSITGDYTAATLGAAYRDTLWSGNGRMEIRNASTAWQKNLQIGMQRALEDGRSVAAGFTLRKAYGSTTGTTRNSDLRLSYAHRPNDGEWIWFDRADYITQASQGAVSQLNGAKLVNNLNANYMPDRRTQIALQYGAKYVRDVIDGTDYKGYTDLLGAEIRYDLTHDWDISAFGSVMRSVNSGVRDYGMGASIGYNLMENTWVSLGYNVRGLNDRDFVASAYRARGPFITLRMKVDQDTFDLNNDRARPLAREQP
ncbi:MAG: hypothetical protein PHP85_03380 [Gallionella sp.]|nr:hypothetical protein [Gallionella sp.]